ncbi:MAG: EAL domain-containing protein [Hyphomicrobiaceae bacterium]
MARSGTGTWRGPFGSAVRSLAAFGLVMIAVLMQLGPAQALKPIVLTGDQDRLEVSTLGEAYEGRGDTLQIEMAPGVDGATARMAVKAATPGTNPNWLAFALTNPTNKVIELWLTADRYTPIGSGVVWPDLDARRIAAVTHSAGFAPERVRNDRVDIYRLTIERGQTITYVAELASDRFSRINLWKPISFEQQQRERQLFNGIMLGITGLLAVFLTAVFAANHKSIFPMAGLVAWCALALLCVDFGFWHKLFQMKPEDNAQYRAAAEAALAASLVIFLTAFLRVNLWGGFARTLFVVWIAAQLAIVGVAVLDPRLAATVARLSLALIGGLGFVLILVLALRGLDRALALMPTWILFLAWLFGAAVTLTGRMSGEFAISGLVAGLVLILVLIGFTVTQYAFRSAEPMLGVGHGGQQLRIAAMDRAGVAFWEWNVRRDELRLDQEIEAALGLGPGELPSGVDDFLAYVHPADRERFRLELLAIREREGGTLRTNIRLRHADSSYRWLEFEGASVPTSDRRNLRCVGLVRDATDQRRAQERLLYNAVYDSLTSLPNRELFLDRLGGALQRLREGMPGQVAVIFVDVDRFRSVNASFGLVVGDSIILTVSRRIARILGGEGTLARIGGDQFALFFAGQNAPAELAAFAERLRLSLRSPIRIAGEEIVLTGSIGIALSDGAEENPRDLLRNAEVAMYRAKRQGNDRAEIFSPEMQSERAERLQLERDLAQAIQDKRLALLYQPIVSLSNDELIGFEAVVRWQHPKLGIVSPSDLMPLAERADLATRLGSYILDRAFSDIARWQQELPRPEHPLFVTLSLSSRQLLSPELIQEVRNARARSVLPAGTVCLEIPESLVMDNPEQATHVLELLHEAGIELWMERFGTGYSSLPYLGRFPFDAFKIDKALVEWASQGERDAALVRSIVAIAHELGRKVVGDGIASAEDASFLRAIGCHYAQGFHYGEAMGEDEVVRLLRLIRKSERRMRRRGLVRGQEKKKPVEAQAEDAVSESVTDGGSGPVQSAPTAPAAAPASGAPFGGDLAPRPPGPAPFSAPPAPTSRTRPPGLVSTRPPMPRADAVASSPRTLPPTGPGPATMDRAPPPISAGGGSAGPRVNTGQPPPPLGHSPPPSNGQAVPPRPASAPVAPQIHPAMQANAIGNAIGGARPAANGTPRPPAMRSPPLQPTTRPTEPKQSHAPHVQPAFHAPPARPHSGNGGGGRPAEPLAVAAGASGAAGPSGSLPRAALGETTGPPTQPVRRAVRHAEAMASLSPTVAASLDRLAGKADARRQDSNGPPPRSERPKAAE